MDRVTPVKIWDTKRWYSDRGGLRPGIIAYVCGLPKMDIRPHYPVPALRYDILQREQVRQGVWFWEE